MIVYCEDCTSCYFNSGTPLCMHPKFKKTSVSYVFKIPEIHKLHPYCDEQNYDGMCHRFKKKIKGWETIWNFIIKLPGL